MAARAEPASERLASASQEPGQSNGLVGHRGPSSSNEAADRIRHRVDINESRQDKREEEKEETPMKCNGRVGIEPSCGELTRTCSQTSDGSEELAHGRNLATKSNEQHQLHFARRQAGSGPATPARQEPRRRPPRRRPAPNPPPPPPPTSWSVLLAGCPRPPSATSNCATEPPNGRPEGSGGDASGQLISARCGPLLDEGELASLELVLGSHKSSVYVCGCMANLYFSSTKLVDGGRKSRPTGDGWRLNKTGVPALIFDSGLARNRNRRRLSISLIERGSGFVLWSDTIDHLSNYQAFSRRLHGDTNNNDNNENVYGQEEDAGAQQDQVCSTFHVMYLSSNHRIMVGLSFDHATCAQLFLAQIELICSDPANISLTGPKLRTPRATLTLATKTSDSSWSSSPLWKWTRLLRLGARRQQQLSRPVVHLDLTSGGARASSASLVNDPLGAGGQQQQVVNSASSSWSTLKRAIRIGRARLIAANRTCAGQVGDSRPAPSGATGAQLELLARFRPRPLAQLAASGRQFDPSNHGKRPRGKLAGGRHKMPRKCDISAPCLFQHVTRVDLSDLEQLASKNLLGQVDEQLRQLHNHRPVAQLPPPPQQQRRHPEQALAKSSLHAGGGGGGGPIVHPNGYNKSISGDSSESAELKQVTATTAAETTTTTTTTTPTPPSHQNRLATPSRASSLLAAKDLNQLSRLVAAGERHLGASLRSPTATSASLGSGGSTTSSCYSSGSHSPTISSSGPDCDTSNCTTAATTTTTTSSLLKQPNIATSEPSHDPRSRGQQRLSTPRPRVPPPEPPRIPPMPRASGGAKLSAGSGASDALINELQARFAPELVAAKRRLMADIADHQLQAGAGASRRSASPVVGDTTRRGLATNPDDHHCRQQQNQKRASAGHKLASQTGANTGSSSRVSTFAGSAPPPPTITTSHL